MNQKAEFNDNNNKPRGRAKKGNKFKTQLAVLIAAAALVLFAVVLAGYTFLYPNIHFGVQAGGISVGGMSQSEAANTINRQGELLIGGQSIDLSIYNEIYKVEIAEVTNGLDGADSAQKAYQHTHSGNPFARMGRAAAALFGGSNVDLTVAVNEEALALRLDEISQEALRAPIDPSYTLEGGILIIDKGYPGVDFDHEEVANTVKENISQMNFEPYEVWVAESDPAEIDLEAIKAEVDAAPKNATVDTSDGKTILPSQDGIVFDIDTARQIIAEADEDAQLYEVPVTLTPATVSAEQLKSVLFRDTLGAATTSFKSSSAARANNVQLASSFIHNIVLNPGDEFSYNNVVGQRTTARGFQTAGAYLAGKLVDDVGGGVCQPSSTLYMAVLRADLKVTERTNHGMTVGYTPLGEDATVSWGSLDFRFVNDTDYPVKIVVDSSGRQLRMSIVGTKTSDKVVTVEREVLATYPYETIEKEDPTMQAGTTKVDQSPYTGYKVVTYKVIKENGTTTRVQANTSNYKKVDKIVLVGTMPVETAVVPDGEPAGSGDSTGAEAGGGTGAEEPAVDTAASADPEPEVSAVDPE